MLSYQYMDSQYKDKLVWRLSYLYDENPHTWKDCLYITTGSQILRYDNLDDLYLQMGDSRIVHPISSFENHTK